MVSCFNFLLPHKTERRISSKLRILFHTQFSSGLRELFTLFRLLLFHDELCMMCGKQSEKMKGRTRPDDGDIFSENHGITVDVFTNIHIRHTYMYVYYIHKCHNHCHCHIFLSFVYNKYLNFLFHYKSSLITQVLGYILISPQ